MRTRRTKLIVEIYEHAAELRANQDTQNTLAFMLSTMSDKALTVFHREFMGKKSLAPSNQKNG